MEAKVHEATNNEAWGASSTLMQEIAQATFHYEYFNEIMPTIYKRFTEKEARQWRQIYKSLVLLEYLVKNGSERVVDDARSHVSMIKMMKNFHYIDEKGKDQGVNVRNRAKELAELLNDVETIKAERKKAKKNRNKYTGVGSDGGMAYSSSSVAGGSRYEGFGSDVGYSGGSYGNSFDERPGRYDEETSNSSPALSEEETTRSNVKETTRSNAKAPTTAKELNLFDFDEPADEQQKKSKSSNTNDDDWGDFAAGNDNEDEFDDFQSAPTVTTNKNTNTTHTLTKSNDVFDLLGEEDTFTSTQPSNTPAVSFNALRISDITNSPSSSSSNQVRPNPPSDSTNTNTVALGGIWSQASNLVSLDSLGSSPNQLKATPQGPSMNSLKTSNVNAGWNNWASANTPQKKPASSTAAAFDDLLF
ncbi:hypothetical protein BD560DRAFT_392867 [Blakeslea trispora]|nr:hypothetical protein BD560DRAFT_392867 [Blakeslea trispora]